MQTDPTPVALPTPPPAPEPAKPIPSTPPKPLRLAVLVSDDLPEYAAVAHELIGLSEPREVELFELRGQQPLADAAVERLRESGHENVVAIGLLAARAARQSTTARVVLCQVFNHQEQQLLGPRSRGIEAIPPLDEAIKVWRGLGKGPRRIGVITGAGHEAIIGRARKTLAKQGIVLRHVVTESDKETMLEFKRMLPDIDGYWLLPDNRVLSRDALRDVMSLSKRAGVGVLVHDPRFFEMGALISAASDPKEIAATARTLLRKARDQGQFHGPQMQALSRCRIQVNATVATQLGYRLDSIPKALVAE